MQKRFSEVKKVKTPMKPGKLRLSQLPKKDLMRSELSKQKIGSVQTVSNPIRSSSQYFAEKPVYSQILDDHSTVYRDRLINFEKKELTGKINENRAKGFISAKKVAKQVEVPIKLSRPVNA